MSKELDAIREVLTDDEIVRVLKCFVAFSNQSGVSAKPGRTVQLSRSFLEYYDNFDMSVTALDDDAFEFVVII